MAVSKYRIALELGEVQILEDIVRKGAFSARTITRARVLLLANENGPKKPQVCIDEKSKQLLSRKRASKRIANGKPKRTDYEYVRHGTVNIFMTHAAKPRREYFR